MTSRRRPSLVEQNSLRGRGHIAGKGVGRVAVETQQRLDLSAKSGGYLVLRVVLLALRWRWVGQLAEEGNRVLVHVRSSEARVVRGAL